MTRLGAQKKREANTWTYVGEPEAPAVALAPLDVWTEEQAKTACAVTLALMLLLEHAPPIDEDDPSDDRKSWYMQCVELSCAAPGGSFRNVFWWSLRYMRLRGETFDEAVDYFLWKTDQFDSGRIRREAVW